MHVHIGRSPTWFDREIVFRRSDAAGERGRAIGVVLAAMLPEIEAPREEAPRDEPPPAESPVAAEPSAPPTPPVATPPVAPAPTFVPRSEYAPRAGFGVSSLGSFGLGGPAAEGGGAVDARWFLGSRVALRAVGELRFGSLTAARATSRTWIVGAGATLQIVGGPRTRADLGLRADALASYLRVTRTSTSSGVDRQQTRWLPALDLAIEASWHVMPWLSVTIALGAEETVGTTDLIVDGVVVARLAPTRAFGELGIRLLF
jgi:hypothetical protein